MTMPASGCKKILIVHGYLLQDSGSCVYVRNLATGFHMQGHHVTIACQDIHAEKLKDIVHKTEDVNFPENDGVTAFIPMPPFMNHVLPVYFYNPYEGYNAKTIVEMTEQEGEEHIQFVSKRLADLISVHSYDFIMTNHCLFSPINVKRALEMCGKSIPYVSKIHGSALNTIAAKDKRWLPFIYEGLRGAKKIICGTRYMQMRLFDVLTETLPPASIIPCGVNTALFSGFPRVPRRNRPFNIIFWSHILNTKGIGELLLAISHVKGKHPNIQFHVAGTGMYVDNFQRMIEALDEGDAAKFEANAFKNDFVAKHVEVKSLFKKIDTDFIKYHGFLTHDILAPLLATCDIMVAPSKADEAFGMVTIEALAAGVYPVVADHSGLSNVVDIISSYDSAVTNCMKIPYPDGRIDVGELIAAVNRAVEFVKSSDDQLAGRLRTISKNLDWKEVCDMIMN
ncbi:uncharacterized protein LOC135497963 [Lineus longissimus]|uniref:uncharacterized protein LOC135497963 n=1 Tax=Lineus longissimus TaxID=88925 RepID=UPI002B4F0F70